MTRNKNKFFASIIICIILALNFVSLVFAKDIDYPKPDEAVVYTSAGLKTALTSTNVTKVYLGANITVTQNDIEINTKGKPHITIEGINPYAGNGVTYTLTEYNQGITGSSNTIRIVQKCELEKMTIKNINIIGQNWYGIFHVRDGVKGITQEFQNVKYDGPQPIYNRGGFAILDNVHITLRDGVDSRGSTHKNTGEVAEIAGVTLRNSVIVNRTTVLEYDEIFWIASEAKDKGYITVEPNANVKITNASYSEGYPSGFVYSDSKFDFKILEGATFEYDGYRIFWECKPITNLIVAENATVKIEISGHPTSGKVDFPGLKIETKGNLELHENSDFQFILKNNKKAQPALYLQSGKIISNNPRNLLIYNDNGLAIKTNNDSGVEMTGSKIAYWENASANPNSLGTPKYLWENRTGKFKATGVTKSDGTFKSFNSYDYDNSGDTLTAQTFALKGIKVVSSNGAKQFSKNTVTFESNGGTPVAPIITNQGTPITKPADPIKPNFKFAGWFKDSALTSPWDFSSDIVNSDITLYAKWNTNVIDMCYVTFDLMGVPGHIGTIPVLKGERVISPAVVLPDPSYTFEGWYTDPTAGTEWDFNDVVLNDMTLYARWGRVQSTYTVKYIVDNDINNPYYTDTANNGDLLKEPTKPTKPGYDFIGWSLNPNLTTMWNFSNNIVTKNLVLYAIFTKSSDPGGTGNTFTVNFVAKGGSNIPADQQVKSGFPVKPVDSPNKPNDCFSGWFADPEFKERWIFSRDKIYKNTTLYGKWCYGN